MKVCLGLLQSDSSEREVIGQLRPSDELGEKLLAPVYRSHPSLAP